MQERVEQFLREKRKEERAAEAQERAEALMKLGLWEKEYGYGLGSGAMAADYPETEPDGRRYRRVPIQVTEEEWAQIAPYVRRQGVNKLAIILQILAVVCYLWGACSWVAYLYNSRTLPLLLGAVLGTLCLGVAELLWNQTPR